MYNYLFYFTPVLSHHGPEVSDFLLYYTMKWNTNKVFMIFFQEVDRSKKTNVQAEGPATESYVDEAAPRNRTISKNYVN